MLVLVLVEGSQETKPFELPDDDDVELLVQLVQVELGIPANEQLLSFNGRSISSGKLQSAGITDGSTVNGECYNKELIASDFCRSGQKVKANFNTRHPQQCYS